jgi:hypothetical protein
MYRVKETDTNKGKEKDKENSERPNYLSENALWLPLFLYLLFPICRATACSPLKARAAGPTRGWGIVSGPRSSIPRIRRTRGGLTAGNTRLES